MNNIESFKKNGYCIVRNAVNSDLRDVITQYALFDEMQNYNPEGYRPNSVCVPNAHSKYADPAMESMLMHLQETMENNTGLRLDPTYSYYRVYRKGDDLKRHKDRPSCEISATLCFNYSYDDKNFQWPIYMDDKEVILHPGDLVIYRGCDLTHWREEFMCQDNDWHVQGFFHYVNVNGPYAEYKFDQRESLGDLNKKKQTESDNNPKNDSKSYIEYL